MDAMLGFIEIEEDLSTPYQRLVDENFRDDDTLRRFFAAPASMKGHHAYARGLLDHAVDTAQIVGREVAEGRKSCDFDTAMTAALLHDLGKTMEYDTSVKGSDRLVPSTRGVLVGHKLTGMELITQAATRLHDLAAISNAKVPVLTDDQLAALIHALTACPAPDYVGLRSPITPEANLVAAADRMSADSHLYSTLAPEADAGADSSTPWGRSHSHLGRKRSRPYYVRQLGGAAA